MATVSARAQDLETSRWQADVRAAGYYTDNFYYDGTDDTRTSSAGGLINPRATWKSSSGKLDLSFLGEGEIGTFDVPGSVDDYADAHADAGVSWLATRRSRLELRGGFRRGHDPFGTNRTEDATVEDVDIDIWHTIEGGLKFHYGAPEAILNAEVGVSALERTYQTNSAATRFLDYTSSTFQYTLFYNYSPKTAWLIDFARTNVQFEEPFAATDGRSGDEYRIRTGIRWLATAKTSGDVRVGTYRREFEETSASEGGLDWEASVQWAPRARTLLRLGSRRQTQESYRADTSINVAESVSVSWKQNWSARTNSQLTLDRTTNDFVGAGRDDTLYNANLGVDYLLSTRMSLVLGLDAFKRESNDTTSEFDRLTTYLGVRVGI